MSAANSVISKNKDQLDKVWTSNDLGDRIKVNRAMTDSDEAVIVASNILETKQTDHVTNNNFSILYRTNAQSRSMEEALRKDLYLIEFMADCLFIKEKKLKT